MTNKTKGQPTNLTLAEALKLLDYCDARAAQTAGTNAEAFDSAMSLIKLTLDGIARNVIQNGVTIHTGSDTPAPEGSPVVEVERPDAEAPAAEQPAPAPERTFLDELFGLAKTPRAGAKYPPAAPKEQTFHNFLRGLTAEAMARSPLNDGYPKYTFHDVERAALFRFGNLTEAARWMDTHHHELGHQTPRAMATQGYESCERLIRLLLTVRQGVRY